MLQWFSNYLVGRTQCVALENLQSALLTIKAGVPQGSVLGPILFSLYINDIDKGLNPAKVHLYADDTILYTVGTSVQDALASLQTSFISIQKALLHLKLALNKNKTKYMIFTRSRSCPDGNLETLDGTLLERVSSYKYLGIWLDQKLTFEVHINNLLKKLRPKVGFYFRLKKCFSFLARKRLVQSTFLSVLDYGDTIYMHAPLCLLKKLDAVYHSALRFVTGAPSRTHHCDLYSKVQWPSLYLRRKLHMLLFIAKALLGKLPYYICNLLTFCTLSYGTRSSHKLLLQSCTPRTELGKTGFSFYAPYLWNELQKILCMDSLPSLETFKREINTVYTEECHCF